MIGAGVLLALLSFWAFATAVSSTRSARAPVPAEVADRAQDRDGDARAASGGGDATGTRQVILGLAGGLGLACGLALIGIGVGRWTRPRRPRSEADYTGPGDVEDSSEPPRVV